MGRAGGDGRASISVHMQSQLAVSHSAWAIFSCTEIKITLRLGKLP